jgi:hypothetical protein
VTSKNNDPDVKLPKAVVAAAARSDEIHKAAYKPEGGDPPADPPVTPSGNEPPAPQPAPEVDWQHRYNSLKGRFDQQASQLASATARIANLEATIASLNKPPAPPKAQEQPATLVKPEEVTEYGPDFVDFVKRAAKEAVAPELKGFDTLRADIDSVKSTVGQVSKVTAATAHEKFLADMTKSLPNWPEINKNPDFLAWLALPDPLSGAIRKQMLDDAYGRRDARRVLAFFNGFLKEVAGRPAEPPPGQSPQTPPGKVTLESLAAPGKANGTPPTPPAEKPTFTRAQITAFYNDRSRGAYRGREEEAEKIELAIFAAQKEGRVL